MFLKALLGTFLIATQVGVVISQKSWYDTVAWKGYRDIDGFLTLWPKALNTATWMLVDTIFKQISNVIFLITYSVMVTIKNAPEITEYKSLNENFKFWNKSSDDRRKSLMTKSDDDRSTE